MAATAPDQWMVRTAENRIRGPYSRQQLCQMIQQGKLQMNDEVCHANRYWFYLHENLEIKEQLGIELPKELYRDPEEATQTGTDTEVNTTRGPVRPAEPEKVLELSQSLEDIGENTAVMSNRAFRDFRQHKKSDSVSTIAPSMIQIVTHEHPVPRLPERKIPLERSRLVQLFTYLMMIGAVALLVEVILLLRRQPGG